MTDTEITELFKNLIELVRTVNDNVTTLTRALGDHSRSFELIFERLEDLEGKERRSRLQ